MPFSTNPKDAVEKKRGTLNRTLNVNASLTMTFHDSKPPTQAQVLFLSDSLAIAKKALLAARRVVLDMRRAIRKSSGPPSPTLVDGSTKELKPELYKIFTYHLHFDPLSDLKNWSAWKSDLERVTQVFQADSQHIFQTITIGDTHRLVLRKEFATVKDPVLQGKITGDGKASEGFVNLKKSAWDKIDNNPLLFDLWVGGSHKFAPDEWGNIKVDYRILCVAPRLQVAGTIIHETTHKMVNAVDHCYASDSGTYKTLTKAQAMDNADSYAFTAICLYKMTFIKNDDKLKELGIAKTIDVQT